MGLLCECGIRAGIKHGARRAERAVTTHKQVRRCAYEK